MAEWSLENYQKGGVVDTWGRARPNIIALAKYVAAKAGIPDVRLQFTPGNYAHTTGLGVDIQPGGGSGNPEAMRALRDVVENLDWDWWGLRYAAGMGHEYGGSWGGVERKRRQTYAYKGSDGWHQRHWHLDVHADAPVRDWQSLIKGESAPTGPSKAVLGMLADLDYPDVRAAQQDLGLVTDGVAGPITTKALEAEMSKLDDVLTLVTKTNHAVGRMEPVVRALGGLKPGVDAATEADLDHIRTRSEQTNAAVGRIEREVGTYGQEKGA